MGKYLRYILLFIVLATIFFGAGIGLAELRLRFFSPQKIIIIPEKKAISAPEKTAKSVSADNPVETTSLSETENIEGSTEPTNSEEQKTFSFAILGDTQYFDNFLNFRSGLRRAVKNIQKENPNLVFAVGDLVNSCDKKDKCQQKFNEWKKATAPFSGHIYAAQGNHDRTGGEKADEAWNASFNFPQNGPDGFRNMVYSFDYDNSHFVVLASDKPKENNINDAQRQWLEQDLAKNKKPNTFVFFHEPAYPVSSKIGESLDVNGGDRNNLWNILVRHRVTAVFSGHEHIFSRKNINGVYQFVVGNTDSFNHEAPKPGIAEYSHVGQHYVIVTVAGKKKTVKLYTVDGKPLNSFDFER